MLSALFWSIGLAARAEPAPAPPAAAAPAHIHGVHLTGWGAGSAKFRRRFILELRAAGLNAVVIALKDFDGRVFVRGAAPAEQAGAYVNAIPDLAGTVREFKAAGIYTIGRIALFEDDWLARHRSELAVRGAGGGLWTNKHGVAWVDPYRREVWDYNLAIASRAVAAGFDEIQFDYIRFPSDGDVSLCRYSRAGHDSKTAAKALLDFLTLARETLKPRGAALSICLFGLTTTADDGMGIGQHLDELIAQADFVSPMMYPSHYHKGEYGIKDPDRDPYRTIHRGLKDAAKRLGEGAAKLRPYLQDFSLGKRYGAAEVRAQILAAARAGVTDWILWNPQNRYTWPALRELDKNTH